MDLQPRLVGVSSELGKQLDSLADMISFGALPGFFLYQMILSETQVYWLPYLGILIIVFSALRLAKFNIDPRQSDVFYGLPTPANAMFITGLPYLEDIQFFSWITSLESLLAIAVLFSLLMVADIPLLSLKFKSFKLRDNWERFLLITMSVILLLVWNFRAISLVILAYLLLSVLVNLLSKKSVNNK